MNGQTFTMPEYPGVTFQLIGDTAPPALIQSIVAIENGQTTTILYGNPISNLYLCDLDGDGKRELCATVGCRASNLPSTSIMVCNYAGLNTYIIQEPNWNDYWLSMENGALVAYHDLCPFGLDHIHIPNPVQGELKLDEQQLLLISEKGTMQGGIISP